MSYLRISQLAISTILVTLASLAHAQTYSVVYNFASAADDPYNPAYTGAIAQGRDGNLYSTAPHGGTCCGAVFKITPAGNLTKLYDFTGGDDGGSPQGGLTLGTDGNFYGTTLLDGSGNAGTVFKITPSGTLITLHSFTGGTDGGYPYAQPVEGNDGNFYGTTASGGNLNLNDGDGCGTVYKVSPSGEFITIYDFDFTHGDSPVTPLVLGTDGNFYGTATLGGTGDNGVVFKLSPAGKFAMLYNFDGTHGEGPYAPLIQGSDGNFYGTTLTGGTHGHGVVFKMSPAGRLSVLHNMNNATNGEEPSAGLVLASDGNFYGANSYGGPANSNCFNNSCGTFFQITPSGTFSVIHNFDGTTGMAPEATPFQHTSGIIYGDTQQGGDGDQSPCSTGNCGVFYSWKSTALPASVSLVSYSGKVGKVIEVLGQGFANGQTTVSFDGTASNARIVSSTYLTVAVPNGATTGPVTVTTSGVELTGNKKFRVTPQITSFTPTSGPAGTQVTVTGVSLTQTETVSFGGIAAPGFTVDSDDAVTVTVPTGAVTGPIAITTAGGSVAGTGTFTVTE
jgi:uncharacterized repeat protein (TIGR03803 family)